MSEIIEVKKYNILYEFEDIMVAILMDLLMYENMDLVDKAFKLFNQLF